jgi:aminoglycoside phosphotransferase (APT) family kinase protein
MDLVDLLDFINAQHETAFALVGKCAGGTRGAYEIAEPTGRRAVLKFGPELDWGRLSRRAVPIIERMRAVGYPTPGILCGGAAPGGAFYYVQESAPGTPLDVLTPANLELLLALNDQQSNHNIATDQDWSAYAQRVVFEGESGWADDVRAHSVETEALLGALEVATRPHADVALSSTDVVHGDFLPANVLVRDGRVTAVIDFAYAGRGTRALDLARLLVWCYDDLDVSSRDRLYARIGAIAGTEGRSICVAEQLIELVAFMIGYHDRESVDHAVRVGWWILADLAGRN